MRRLKNSYYTDFVCQGIFDAVENPQWRIWKLLEGDQAYQNKFPISSPKKLKQFIGNHNPDALYISVNEFYQAQKNHGFFFNQKVVSPNGYFYPRAGYLFADNIMLKSRLFFDIDHETDIGLAQQDARKIIKYMAKKRGFKLSSVQFSGTKGLHLVFDRPQSKIESPNERIRYYRKQNELIIAEIKKLKLKTFDETHYNIVKDMYRVYAAPLSVKRSGGIVTPLDPEQFMAKDVKTLLPSTVFRQAIEAKADDNQVAPVPDFVSAHPTSASGKERDGLSSYPYFYRAVSNMVHGLKNNYVTVLKIPEKKFSLTKLKSLQTRYKLSTFHIMKLGTTIYAVNLKLVQYKRLVKIMRAAKSQNLRMFLTRGQIPIPLSDEKRMDNSVINPMEYLGRIDSKHGIKDFHSKPHSDIFRQEGVSCAGADRNRLATILVVA